MAIIDIRGSEHQGGGSWIRSDVLAMTGALIIATLVTAVLLLLAAIDPVTFTFQSNTVSHLRSEIWTCLSLGDDAAGLDCYDDLARQPGPHPARGANVPVRLLAK